MFEGVFAFAAIERSEFENVRRGVIDAHGKRAEIVQRRDFDFLCIHCIKDTGQEGNSYTVAQLGVFETEIADFAKHGAAVGVTLRVPTR